MRYVKMIAMAILQAIFNFLKTILVMLLAACVILLMLFMRAMVTYSEEAPPIAKVVIVVILAIGVGLIVYTWFFSKPEPTAPPLPPDLDEAARAHFDPSTPPLFTDERIKQPDAPGPDTTDPHP